MSSAKSDLLLHSIEENPVTAGLVTSAAVWPWSSAGWQAKPPAPPTSDLSPGNVESPGGGILAALSSC